VIAAFALLTALLLGLWLLLAGAATPGSLLLGTMLAAVGAALTVRRVRRRLGPQLRRPPGPEDGTPPGRRRTLRRLLRIPRQLAVLGVWLAHLMVDIVQANFRIAALVLDPHRALQPVYVELPLTLESPLGVYLLAAAISLTPGTLTAELRPQARGRPRVLLVHAIDRSELGVGHAHAPDAARWAAALKARYEEPLLEVFR